ncbi:MAG: hypothetical protein V9F03_12195 [Microthrixaceae bacterium]
MIIWFAAMSIILTWMVFQSPALDYRLVALGAVLPVIEVPFGGGPLHSLGAATFVLAVVMIATQKRRLLRRQLLGLPIGLYVHLILDGAFMDARTFWWPFMGLSFTPGPAPELSRGFWSLVMEVIGIGAAIWAYGRFGLDDPLRRQKFLSTGQLDRSVMGS